MSAYIELYADYIDAIKSYNQDFSVTPLSFMRNYTRGMQIFQRETEYIEDTTEITPANDGFFYLPDNVLRIIEMIDEAGITLVPNDYRQFRRNIQTQPIQNNTPGFYNLRNVKEARLFTVYNRRIIIFPSKNDKKIILKYKVFIPPLSYNEPYWQAFFPLDVNFEAGMQNSPPVEFLPYEGAILDFAIATYLKSIGSPNYQIYEKNFWDEIERAKINRQILATEAVADYNMSPYTGAWDE